MRTILTKRAALAACTVLAVVTRPAPAQQTRAPVVESLELRMTSRPRTVRVDGALHLVYELHLTNPTPDTVRVVHVVLTAGGVADTIARLGAEQLAAALRTPSRRPTDDREARLAPGGRRVLHGWWPLHGGRSVPARLEHHIVVQSPPREPIVLRRIDTVSASRASPVALGAPLRGGEWVAVYDPWLQGGHRMAFYTVDGRMRIPARFAVDFVRLPPGGRFDRSATGQDRNGFGEAVLAVADGEVVAALDDMPDQADAPGAPRPTFTLESASGNMIALRLADGRVAIYEHLKSGSVRVRVGQRVRRGAVVAALGYSGSASIGPHLHFHVADEASLLGAEGVPWVLDRFEELGRYASTSAFVEGQRHTTQATPLTRRAELPAANAVVRFRE